jgi:hypothetical protein
VLISIPVLRMKYEYGNHVNIYMSVGLIGFGPPSYFTHISITTPIVSALKNYYI